MQIIITCECGNKAVIPATAKKYTQFRDFLEREGFYLCSPEIKNGVLKEFKIECGACKRYIVLGID